MQHFFTTELTEREDSNSLTGIIIGSAIEIHRALGPGLLESAYEACQRLASGNAKTTTAVL